MIWPSPCRSWTLYDTNSISHDQEKVDICNQKFMYQRLLEKHCKAVASLRGLLGLQSVQQCDWLDKSLWFPCQFRTPILVSSFLFLFSFNIPWAFFWPGISHQLSTFVLLLSDALPEVRLSPGRLQEPPEPQLLMPVLLPPRRPALPSTTLRIFKVEVYVRILAM